MSPVLIDSNVLIDIVSGDPLWGAWSREMLSRLAEETSLIINPLIYAEVSTGFRRIEDLEAALPDGLYQRDPLPYEAAFLAAKVFNQYKRRGGLARSPLPDFYIGAHAAIAGLQLLTRDQARYRTYFPGLELITPPGSAGRGSLS